MLGKLAKLLAVRQNPRFYLHFIADNSTPWRNQTTSQRVKTVIIGCLKVVLLVSCLWLFICSLKLMTEALNVLGLFCALQLLILQNINNINPTNSWTCGSGHFYQQRISEQPNNGIDHRCVGYSRHPKFIDLNIHCSCHGCGRK